jgi:DNA topoisomerase IB
VPPEESLPTRRDPALIKLVTIAHMARQALAASPEPVMEDIAKGLGYSRDYLTVLLRISYLAPDIVAAILDGRQPAQLNRQKLARLNSLPIDWQAQRAMLGFT